MSKEQTTEIIKKDPLQVSLEVRNMDVRQFRVIKEILYPNVQKDETLLMAIDYCRARNLDIMKRTIQIVPIWDSKAKCMKDTIWPSIAEIRITATRTGKYAGRSEAEFGEEVTESLGGIETTYPKWCKISVYRFVNGEKCEFSAKLFWKETYKTAKNDTLAPNSMWAKRSYAQFEKCTEAAALRAAFPEETGNDYIAEEAFDANEGLVNVTPKSKTTAAHTPPAGIEKSFAPSVILQDEAGLLRGKEAIFMPLEKEEKQVEEMVGEIVTNSDDVAEQAFKRVSEGLKIMANPNSVKKFFEISSAEEIKYLREKRPDYHAELLTIKNKRLEELNAK